MEFTASLDRKKMSCTRNIFSLPFMDERSSLVVCSSIDYIESGGPIFFTNPQKKSMDDILNSIANILIVY